MYRGSRRGGSVSAPVTVLLLCALWGCGGHIPHARIPHGTDAELVCGAWLDSFLDEPDAVPMAPGVEVTYLGVGEDADPYHAVPAGLIASGDPSFDVATAGRRNVHCQGMHRLDAGDGATALWTKTFHVSLDLAWDGERFLATQATIILDSARNESTGTMFERNISGQKPVVGDFTGEGDQERFYSNVAVYQGILPGEVISSGSVMYAEYQELVLLGPEGHLRYHELLFVEPEIQVGEDRYKDPARGSFAQDRASVHARAMDLGLEQMAVMFSWDQWKVVQVPSAQDPDGVCPVTERWRTSSIRLMDGDDWIPIFTRRVEQEQSCPCVEGCDLPGRQFEDYTVELDFKTFVSSPTIIDVIITYLAGGFEHERWEYRGKKYVMVDQ